MNKKLVSRVAAAFKKMPKAEVQKFVGKLLRDPDKQSRVRDILSQVAIRKAEAKQAAMLEGESLKEGLRVPFSRGKAKYHKEVRDIPWNPRMEGHLADMDDAAQAVSPMDRYTEVKKNLRAVEEAHSRSKDPGEHLTEKGEREVRASMEHILDRAKEGGDLRFGPDPEDLRRFRFANRRAGIALRAEDRISKAKVKAEANPKSKEAAAELSEARKNSMGKKDWAAQVEKGRGRYRKVGAAAGAPFGDKAARKAEDLLGRGSAGLPDAKARALRIKMELEKRYTGAPDQHAWVPKEGTQIGEDLVRRVHADSSHPEEDLKMMQERVPHLLKLAENRADYNLGRRPPEGYRPTKAELARGRALWMGVEDSDSPELVKKVLAARARGAILNRYKPEAQRAMIATISKRTRDRSKSPKGSYVSPVMEKVMERKVPPIGAQLPGLSVTPKQLKLIQETPQAGPVREKGKEPVLGKKLDWWISQHQKGKLRAEGRQQLSDLLTLRAVERGEKKLADIESPRLRMLIKTVLKL